MIEILKQILKPLIPFLIREVVSYFRGLKRKKLKKAVTNEDRSRALDDVSDELQ